MRITQKKKRSVLFQMLVLSFSLLVLAGTSYADPSQGLVAHYPFDGNADDASGNGHNGTPYGAALTSDRMGNPNSAFRFDGQSYILVPEDGSFNVSKLTIGLWISFLSGPYCTGYVRPMSFVSKSAVNPVGSNTGYIFPYIGFGDCNSFGLIVNTLGSSYSWDFNRSYSYTNIIEPDKWHHYTATYDGSAKKVYIDCKLVSTDYNQPGGVIQPNNNDLYIGVQAGTQEYATADMDDVLIYGRALSDAEVESLCVQPAVAAQVVVNPDTLNLSSSGKWMTVYIELAEGFQTTDIDVSSVTLMTAGGTAIQASGPSEIGDYNGNSVNELMVKFDRQALSSQLSAGSATLKVSGKLSQDRTFEGEDTIRTID
jgi:hypothetical protein